MYLSTSDCSETRWLVKLVAASCVIFYYTALFVTRSLAIFSQHHKKTATIFNEDTSSNSFLFPLPTSNKNQVM